jgi:hypothetical protein
MWVRRNRRAVIVLPQREPLDLVEGFFLFIQLFDEEKQRRYTRVCSQAAATR